MAMVSMVQNIQETAHIGADRQTSCQWLAFHFRYTVNLDDRKYYSVHRRFQEAGAHRCIALGSLFCESRTLHHRNLARG